MIWLYIFYDWNTIMYTLRLEKNISIKIVNQVWILSFPKECEYLKFLSHNKAILGNNFLFNYSFEIPNWNCFSLFFSDNFLLKDIVRSRLRYYYQHTYVCAYKLSLNIRENYGQKMSADICVGISTNYT